MAISCDVLVIGGGVVGCSIARQLSKYSISTVVAEAREDVARGASGANSGIVHAGYDPVPGSKMAKYNVKGCAMYEDLSEKLDFPYKKVGSLVLAFSEEDRQTVQLLYERGTKNGVPDMQILDAAQVLAMEKNASDKVVGALYAPSCGITSPYEATIAFADNAVENGVKFLLAQPVVSIKTEKNENGRRFTVSTADHTLHTRVIINCAGTSADIISRLAGGEEIPMTERKGEYTLYDRNLGGFVSHVLFQTPDENGKGVLVTPTAEGNLLLGPNSIVLDAQQLGNTATTQKGQDQIYAMGQKTCPKLPFGGAITGFSGIRAVSGDDFVIEPSSKVEGLIQVAGICSPGLTSAPAIAEDVAQMALSQLEKDGVTAREKEDFIQTREGIPNVREMSWEEREELCRKDPRFGRIVCRCETVTEGQIRKALNLPLKVYTIDGVKRRCRAGMGRCQGSFCTPRVMEIISEESGIPFDQITKAGKGTAIAQGRLKGV